MKAELLLQTLLEQPDLDHTKIQAIYDQLPSDAKIAEFRHLLVEENIMSYIQVMKIFVQKTLLPKGNILLEKIEHDRSQRVHHKPERHVQKFFIQDDDQFISDIAFSAGDLPVHIPHPKLDEMAFKHSDEKQAVMLAVEMVELGELNEAEIVLLETLESFKDSTAAILILCWTYLSTGHAHQSEFWAKTFIKEGNPDQRAMELLCLAEQVQNKHLLASAHYQKLIQLKRVKSIWYLLLAYSLERSNCLQEAAENYQIYTKVAHNPTLKNFANLHLQELTRS
jgi:tetratricopeptide (TPR) repeat protein